LIVLGACGFTPTIAPGDGRNGEGGFASEPIPEHHYRKQITITANSPSELVDFPVSIVTTDLDLMAHGHAADIGFTALDGTPLSYEIVAYDGTTGTLEAWVRIPSVTATADIVLVYGGAPVTPNAKPTWANYAAAWHFAESSGTWADSAGGHAAEPATATTTAAPTPTGLVGSARDFDGVDDASPVPEPADNSLDFGTGSFSVTAWVNVTTSADPYDEVIDKSGDTNLPGYCFPLGTSNWLVEISDGPNVRSARFSSEAESLGHWVMLTAVIDRSIPALIAYTNGALAQSTSISGVGSLDNDLPLAIGSTITAYRFKGTVDEVRVVKQALTLDWIAAEYRNAMMRAAFVTFGAEQML
jgi:hypothetical protein